MIRENVKMYLISHITNLKSKICHFCTYMGLISHISHSQRKLSAIQLKTKENASNCSEDIKQIIFGIQTSLKCSLVKIYI